MRILIIDNNLDQSSWGADDLQRYARLRSGATIHVRRGPQNDLPVNINSYDRLIISGSRQSCLATAPWVEQLDEIIRKALNEGKPILGVCYGHQSVARALAGREILRRAKRPEFGWVKIETLEPSALFTGLPATFHSFGSHFEEIATPPPGTRLLARSEHCAVQAYQLEEKPVFGIQFHPERELEDATESLLSRQKKGMGHLLLRPKDGHRLFDPKVGETIFRNFFSL